MTIRSYVRITSFVLTLIIVLGASSIINMNNSQLKDSIENMGNTLRTSVNDAKNELANRADTNTEIVVQKINSANSSTGNKKPAKKKIQSGSSSGNKKPLPTNRKPTKKKPNTGTTGKNKDGKKKIKSGSATTSKNKSGKNKK